MSAQLTKLPAQIDLLMDAPTVSLECPKCPRCPDCPDPSEDLIEVKKLLKQALSKLSQSSGYYYYYRCQ